MYILDRSRAEILILTECEIVLPFHISYNTNSGSIALIKTLQLLLFPCLEIFLMNICAVSLNILNHRNVMNCPSFLNMSFLNG